VTYALLDSTLSLADAFKIAAPIAAIIIFISICSSAFGGGGRRDDW